MAHKYINLEAGILAACFLFFGGMSVLTACSTSDELFVGTILGLDLAVPRSGVLIYVAGCLGGTLFSIKWLLHAVGTGRWHRDRFYWRVFVPFTAGVYAILVGGLIQVGLMGDALRGEVTGFVVPILIGYFGDGVNGVLSNIASAIFGTVEKK